MSLRALLAVALETCWLAAALLAIDTLLPPLGQAALPAACALYPAGYAMGRIAQAWTRNEKLGWLLCAALGFIAVGGYAALCMDWSSGAGGALRDAQGTLRDAMNSPHYKRLLVVLALGGAAWVRAWLLAGRTPGFDSVAASFQFCLVGLLLMLPFARELAAARETLMALDAAFMGFALLALWRARSGEGHGLARGPGLAAIFFAMAAVLGLGAGLAAVFDRTLLTPVLAAAGRIGTHLMNLAGMLFGWVPAQRADAGLQAPTEAAPPFTGNTPGWLRPVFAFMAAHAAALGALLCCAMAAGALYYFFLRYRRRRAAGRQRTPGLVYRRSSGNWRDGLARLWRWLLLRTRAMAGAFYRGVRNLVPRRLDERSVRAIYAAMLQGLEKKGWPRAAHETAEEFRRRIAPRFPGDTDALDALTAAFAADRYGPRRIAPEGAMLAWQRLRGEMKNVRRADG